MIGATLLLLLLNDDVALEAGQLGVDIGNQGTSDIVVGTLTITGDTDAFSIFHDPVSNTTIEPGGKRRVIIEATTTTPGQYLATLRIPSSDPDGVLTVALISNIAVTTFPAMSVSPTGTVDFGSVDITSGSKAIPFTVHNTGTAPLVMGTVTLTGAGYTKTLDGVSGVTIAPGASAGLYVTLDPSSIGTKTGTLTFPATGLTSVVVSLTGLGTSVTLAPVISVSPTSWNGGTVQTGTGGVTRTVTVTNTGDANLVIGVCSISGTSFSVSSDGITGATIAPGASRTALLKFDPGSAGAKTGSYTIPSNAGASVVVSLTGTGTATSTDQVAIPGIDPSSLAFGSIAINGGPLTRLVTLGNVGQGENLTVGQASITGTGFSITNDNVSGTVLGPGFARTLTVRFDPSSVGAVSGTLTVPTSRGSVTVSLTGTGTAAVNVVSRFYLSRQPSPVADTTDPVDVWVTQTPDPDFLLAAVKGGPVVSLGTTVDSHYPSGSAIRLGRWISQPLAAQSVDTTILCYCVAHRSSALGATVSSAMRLGIQTGSSVAWGGLKALGGVTSPWRDSTNPLPRRFPAGTPLSWRMTCTFAAGDRLVVELGARVFTSNVGGLRIRWGGSASDADLESTEAPATVDLTKAPWIEFTDGLTLA